MNEEPVGHYYGDKVRVIFVIGGMMMALSYPFFNKFINAPLSFSLFGCIILSVVGGLMNPRQKWITALGVIISIFAFGLFQYYAVDTYLHLPPSEDSHIAFFWANQILSIMFFFAAYLSTKTLRGFILRDKDKDDII